jgi:hypothetical protein
MRKSYLSKAKGLALAGIAGAMLVGGGLTASTTPAEAGASTGTWKYGTPYRGAYRGAYRGGYAYRGGPRYYGRGYNRGGAVAAGVATGLAVGALGAAAAAPYGYPAYGYPAYGYPAYGVAPAYDGDCYWTDRQAYDAWGRIVVQRVQVCD